MTEIGAPEPQPKERPSRSALGLGVVLLVVPLMVVLGAAFQRRSYTLLGVLIIVTAMVPLFASFERRRPRAREVVTLAVMMALSIASRVAFAFVPQFKPMAAIVMISGIALGAPAGFLVGSLAAYVSNFIFGQGPWTPFQMLGFGLCGYLFGFLADRGVIPRDHWRLRTRVLVSVGGYGFIQFVVGPILDSSSLFWMLDSITPESAAAIFLAGAPMNAVHGIATSITLFLVGDPILGKLTRLKMKHGLMKRGGPPG